MRRRDIKRGTYIIILAVFLMFILIIIIGTSIARKNSSEEQEEDKQAACEMWSDTLSNSASGIPVLAPMDADIERFMQKWNIRGMSLAVMRHDSLLYAKGLGWADKEKNEAMEANTTVRIASVSKLITAAAVMKLVEQGKIGLDDKVFGENGILSGEDYAAQLGDERMKDITVRNILCHEAGFTRRLGDPMFSTLYIMETEHLSTPPDARQLARIVLSRKLSYAPGAGHKYSNFGYMMLSLLIEKVSGKSYWDYVTEDVLHEAGCYGFKPATNYYADRYTHESKYYAPDDSVVYEYNGSGRQVNRVYGGSNVNGLMGAGGWVTSAADLARFIAAIDGNPHLPDIISRRSFEEMTRFDPEKKVSFGWSGVDGTGKLTRTGTLSSTNAIVQCFPDGECWVMVTNTGAWTGFRFSRDMEKLIEVLRSRYSKDMPARDIFCR